jgi:hypothetical protein
MDQMMAAIASLPCCEVGVVASVASGDDDQREVVRL